MLWAFKDPIRGVGAPTPNFDPYASSYNHIFIQNTSKLHFLYPARLVWYEYVVENVEKITQPFFRGEKYTFFSVSAATPIFESYISSFNNIFIKMPQNCTFCIQPNSWDMNMWKIFQHFLPHTHIQLVLLDTKNAVSWNFE